MRKIVKVRDCEGTEITLAVDERGQYKMPIQATGLTVKETLKEYYVPCKDDVFVCTYPKSGTHWVWEIVHMMLNKTTAFSENSKEGLMIDYGIDLRKIEELKSPRVLNSHALTGELYDAVLSDQSRKIVQVVRNPKDIYVSMFHHFRKIEPLGYENGTWKGFFGLAMRGAIPFPTWERYMNDWWPKTRNSENVLWIFYEDLHSKPMQTMQKINMFLGCKHDKQFLRNVYDTCHIDRMRKVKGELMIGLLAPSTSDQIPPTKSHHYYRQGQVGKWKETFTVEQNESFDNYLKKKERTLLTYWSKLNTNFENFRDYLFG